MATKRMFSKAIVQSDPFLRMSTGAQALYLQLNLSADDDGIINNAGMISRMCGLGDDALKELIDRRFLLQLPSGLLVVKHWRINNRLQNDRHKSSHYMDELDLLHVKPDGAYTFDTSFPKLLHNLTDLCPQVRKGKESIEKESIGEYSKAENREAPSDHSEKKVYGYHKNVFLTDEEGIKLFNTVENANTLIERASTYLFDSEKEYDNHYTLLMKIAREDGYRVKENE